MTGHVRISLAAWCATVLGSIVLAPVFSGPFLFISALLCGAVTATGILLQHYRAPRFVVPVVQLVVLAELISLSFLGDTLRFGVLPWKETAVEFNQQLVNAMDAINRFSAPLPPEPHLTVFAASVVSVAGLLIHLIAVQLRQAAWAGLLLLTMYTVPAATVHGGLPALLFIPPAAGYIVLLSAEGRARLSRWGRRISGVSHLDAVEPIEASALGQAGRRIGLSVVALAAFLPALLPALPEGVVGNGLNAAGTGTGSGASISATNPMLDMGKNLKRGDNVTALTYTGPPSYLRLTALDFFDGNTWTIGPRPEGRKLTGELTPPVGFGGDLSKVEQTRMRIEVTRNFRSQFVPVPYPVQSISLKNRWRFDPNSLDIVSASGQVVGGQNYNLTAYNLQPKAEELRDSLAGGPPDQYTSRVPRGTPESVRQLARNITAGADGNHYREAVLLQEWFRSGDFTYSTETGGSSGMRALTAFLLDNKTGYCEQFATGMALMARIIGIPARVGIGFLPGQPGDGGKQIVRMHDMHAWPELYFQGTGWVRFEPTPAQRVAATPEWTDGAAAPVSPNDPSTTPSDAPTSGPSAEEDPRLDTGDRRNLPDAAGSPVTDTGNWWSDGGGRLVAGIVAVLFLLGIPWLARTLVRRRRFARPPGRLGGRGPVA
jgi:transglutaminase-like putative cysteine protease